MNIIIALIFLLLSISAGVYGANYNEMIEDYEAYQPPSYYDSQFKSIQADEALGSRDSFKQDLQIIDELKSNWVNSLDTQNDESSFLNIDEELNSSLKGIAADDVATHAKISKKFSLETLEALVFLRNSSIKSAENRFIATTEQFSQIANLDEILRQYGAFIEGSNIGVGKMKGREPIESRFPYPGVTSLKSQIVVKSVEMSKEDLEIARREAVTDARKAYWNLQYVHRAYSILYETLSLLTHLEGVATSRYETGKTSYQDVVKIRISKETLAEDLNSLRQKQKNIEIKILELLNLSPDLKVGHPSAKTLYKVSPSLEKLFDVANESRQELRKIRANIGRMELMVELGETMIIPPYTLNLSLYKDEAVNQVGTFNNKDTFAVSTGSSKGAGLPKSPWYGTNDAYLRETRKKIHAQKDKLATIEAKTATMVRAAWFELDKAIREETLYAKTVVDLSQTSLEVSTRAYESGKVSFADVIASYDLWLKSNLTLQKKRSNIGFFNAELKRRIGKNDAYQL